VHLNRSLRSLSILALLILAVSGPVFATQETGPSKAAMAAGTAYLRALESAASAYAGRDFSTALDKLDLADQIQPNIPDTWNMRGAIYADQHAFEKAEDAFEKAGQLDPGDFWPPYNIAQLLLMQKKYAEAAKAFQSLMVYQGHEELVQYKLVFADLLQGKSDDAKKVLDAMKFPSDTPAYYFAHAAWGYARKDQKDGNYWTNAGVKIFGTEPCIAYYDALVGAGWAPPREKDGSMPEPADLSTLPLGNPSPLPDATPQ
jgi:tetratricopeptide (TPR) repeat protein